MSGFKPNAAAEAAWRTEMHKLAQLTGKSDPAGLRKLATQSAKRFVKNVADITPPASGKADAAAKKRGENAIVGDLMRLAIPVQKVGYSRTQARELFATAGALATAHAKARDKATGRVNPRNRKDKLLVEQSTFNRVAKLIAARVGWLAAGLNAAAAKLGFSLPAWIKRHGSKYGRVEVLDSGTRLRIRITQDVPFTNNVRGYARKWKFAIEREAKSLAGMVKAIAQKRIRGKGLKLK